MGQIATMIRAGMPVDRDGYYIKMDLQHAPIVTINLILNKTMKEPTLEQVQQFYEYLQGGDPPKGFHLRPHGRPKLTPKKAYQIIYVLQEGMRIIPDTYEQCWNCNGLFDTNCSGLYWESKGRHYCDSCEYLVPENYDNNKRL